MANARKKRSSVKVKDLRASKNPKGGAFQAHIALKGKKQGRDMK